ncbi:MAG: transposase [Bacteroidetes bacterium]|nr:transposase [Bacteroidota bacterium]
MSEKWKVRDNAEPYFVTFAVNGWVDVFTRNVYRDIFCESVSYCQANKGLELYAWVLMTNHVHMIIGSAGTPAISDIVRDLKKYTSVHITRAIIANDQESRKEWMLNIFGRSAADSIKHEKYLFWQENYHPVQLSNADIFKQKMDYIHDNPVRAGFVFEAPHYLYSSATDFCGGKGLLRLEAV